MKFGLTDKEYRYIHDTVVEPLRRIDAQVWCFGSRVKGTHSTFSDLDLLIEDKEGVFQLIGEIEENVIQSNFPYKVDFVVSSRVASSYIDEINAHKILF